MQSVFNLPHWLVVRAERARRGLVSAPSLTSPLRHETVTELATQKRFKVSAVECPVRQAGFLTAVLRADDGTVRACVVAAEAHSPLAALVLKDKFFSEYALELSPTA